MTDLGVVLVWQLGNDIQDMATHANTDTFEMLSESMIAGTGILKGCNVACFYNFQEKCQGENAVMSNDDCAAIFWKS